MNFNSPIEVANFSFELITGKVLKINRGYGTSIKGSGGGGSISGRVHDGSGSVSGSIAPIKIESTILHETDILLELEDGKQYARHFSGLEFQAYQGQMVTIIYARPVKEKNSTKASTPAILINHDLNEYFPLNRGKKILLEWKSDWLSIVVIVISLLFAIFIYFDSGSILSTALAGVVIFFCCGFVLLIIDKIMDAKRAISGIGLEAKYADVVNSILQGAKEANTNT